MAKKAQPILPSALKRAEYGRTVYVATLDEGVGKSDLLSSDFWVHLSPQLETLDRIEAVSADGETFYELLVSRVERMNDGNRTIRIVKVALLHEIPIGKPKVEKRTDPAPGFVAPVEDDAVRNQPTNRVAGQPDIKTDEDGVPEGYEVTFGGPHYKWRVIKEGVSEPLATGMTKKEAIEWASQHAAKSA